MNATPNRKQALRAVGLCALCYLYVFPFFPALNSPNENVRLYMSAAMVEDASYVIDPQRARWGSVTDTAIKDGVAYSVKAPGASYLGAVGYAAFYAVRGGEVGPDDLPAALWATRLTAGILPALFFLFFLYRWYGAHCRAPIVRDAAFLSVALGSSCFAYALLQVSHTTSAICAFTAFMLLYDARREQEISAGGALLAGLMAAGVTFFEYPGFVVSLALSIYALWAIRPLRRRLPLFIIGALIPTLLVLHFHWVAFGDPLSPGHLYVNQPDFRAAHQEGFFGATGFHWNAAVTLLFDLRFGLFTMTPFFFLAVPGFASLLRKKNPRRADAGVALGACLALFILICLMNNWAGGWAVGPRYLVTLLPLVGWAALRGGDALVEKWPRVGPGVLVAMVIAGLVSSGIPSIYYPHIPDQVSRPLAHLFSVLIEHGYAPQNAGNFVGVYGSWSMLPMLLLALLAVGWLVRTRPRGDLIAVLGIAVTVAVAALLPQFLRFGSQAPKSRRDVARVTRLWHPLGHDRASYLEVRAEGDPDVLLELVEIYRLEGRDAEADDALARHRVLTTRAAR